MLNRKILIMICLFVGTLAFPNNRISNNHSRLKTEQVLISHRMVPTTCGHSNITCSISGQCVIDVATNHSYCSCDSGFRGVDCSERYFFQKTWEIKVNQTSFEGALRYLIHTDPEVVDKPGFQGKHSIEMSLNRCLESCELEIDFICAAAVFFPFRNKTGDCYIVNQRFEKSTEKACFSYSRGPEECYFGDGNSYRGTHSKTISGIECQKWNLSNSHQIDFPYSGLDQNYCRNPSGEIGPWCYKSNSTEWELCLIPKCSTDIKPSTPTPTPTPVIHCPTGCLFHGKCERNISTSLPTGNCICFPGFVNILYQNCSEEVECPNNCSGHGYCSLGSCICEQGWEQGPGDCSEESISCPNTCSGHGSCDLSTGICKCLKGWGGLACDTELFLCPRNCSGNGYCDANKMKCVCHTEYTGPNCSEPLCPEVCSFHGNCDVNTRTCNCHEGYQGPACADLSQPPCLNDCNGNGDCIGGKCFCRHGWTLEDCSNWEAPLCPNNCSNHGSCDNGVCDCEKHYSGNDCSFYNPPKYHPWPIAAIVIPICLVVAFGAWLFYVCYQVDMVDGESDFAKLPMIKWLFFEREKRVTIIEGKLSNSRYKSTNYI